MLFKELAISNEKDLIFGSAPYPVTTRRGLVIGGGLVYPELNFTLPPMEVSLQNLDNVLKQYREIVTGALDRALQLESRGVILELETLLEMTQEPEIGVSIVKLMNDLCEDYHAGYGLASEIRLTPNDLREFERPPKASTSAHLDKMWELFERGAEAGGDFLSIETTGGKEISDDALMMCNMQQFVFSQAVLGVRDMQMIWGKIVAIANKYNRIAGGDTACGFANTAMVLAEKNYIPNYVLYYLEQINRHVDKIILLTKYIKSLSQLNSIKMINYNFIYKFLFFYFVCLLFLSCSFSSPT